MYQLKRKSLGSLLDWLCVALEADSLQYCQWKGHRKLSRWATGKGDIDLLVKYSDAERFRTIVSRLGFKEALPPPERRIPGNFHYYGFDCENNLLLHLHVHYQLIFGHYSTMNYRLPIEETIIDSAVSSKHFRVPSPEFEFILFVIRMAAQYSVSEALLRKQLIADRHDEFDYLRRRADLSKAFEIVEKHLPFIGADLFQACMQSLELSNIIRWRVKQRLLAKLTPHARLSWTSDFQRRQVCRFKDRIRPYISGRQSQTKLVDGGRIVVLLGGDGAGKTTAVEALHSWLSPKFSTMRVHLGKPPKSLFTIIVAVIRRLSLVPSKLRNWHPDQKISELRQSKLPTYLLLLRSVCIARDRFKLYTRAQRFACGGGVVICDRYPTSQLKTMDGPNISRLVNGGHKNRLTELLVRMEASYYKHIMPPDLLIVLKVQPDIAVQRKKDEGADYVRARSEEVWKTNFAASGAYVVDAGREQAEVMSTVRSIVWSGL